MNSSPSTGEQLGRRRLTIALVVGVTIALLATVLSSIAGVAPFSDGSKAGVRATPLDEQLVAQGQAIYQSYCAPCHGPNGEGQPGWQQQNPDGSYLPPPHDASGHTWHHSDSYLYQKVRDGATPQNTPGFKGVMPPFGERLSADEIVAVITYIKSLWGPKEREAQAEVTLRELLH